MSTLRNYIIIIIGGVFFCSNVLAQEQNEGDIKTEEIIINKDLKIELPVSERLYEPVQTEFFREGNVQVNYVQSKAAYDIPEITPKLKVLKLKTQEVRKGYDSYVDIGLGNYATGYVDVMTTGQKDASNYGLQIKEQASLRGPVDKKNSAETHFAIKAFGDTQIENHTLSAAVNVFSDGVRFYGYPSGKEVGEDTIKQSFSRITAEVMEQFHHKNFTASVGLKYRLIGNKYDASENTLFLPLGLEAKFDNNLKFGLNGDFYFSSYKDGGKISRNMYQINPYVKYQNEDWTIMAGLAFGFDNDTLKTDISNTYLRAHIEYYFSDLVRFYTHLDGGLERLDYYTLVLQNPYLQKAQSISNQSKTYGLSFGAKGKLIERLGYDVGLGLSGYKNFQMFVNDPNDQSKFLILYDSEPVKVFNLYLYTQYILGQKVTLGLGMDYFNYNSENFDKVFHKPTLKADFDVSYLLNEKILLSSSFFYLAGRYALENGTKTVGLKNVADLNLGAEYFISDKASAYLKLNNITGKNYQLYNHYPVKGFQVLIGAKFAF